jgi:hypothetical protein
MMAFVGTLAYEFQVTIPVIAKQTFHGGPETYGFLTSAMGAGAVLGGLSPRRAVALGCATSRSGPAVRGRDRLCRAGPLLVVELVAIAAVGWVSVTFLATGNTILQLHSDPSMRDCVMSLWAVAFLGSTPVGGPLIGWIVATTNARIGLGVGGIACLEDGGIGLVAMRKLGIAHRRRKRDDEVEDVELLPSSAVELLPDAD